MIDYKKLQKGVADGSQHLFKSESAMRLKETLKADSDKAGVAVLGGGFATFMASSWVTSGITNSMFSQFGYSGDTMTIAMNLGIVGIVSGVGAYGYSQIPNREQLDNAVIVEQKTETRKTVEDKVVMNEQAFENMNKQAMESDHLYLSATSGSGKTTWANHCLNNYLPDNAQYIVLDPKPEGIQNGVGSKWENAHTIINDVTKFAGTLEKVVGLMLKRQANPEVDNTLLYVILEEATLLDSEAIKHATRLLTTGRSANIRLHFYTQSPSAELNNIKGLTQLFQTIPTVTMYKNAHGQRVIQAAKIISGKLKNLGQPIAIPYLEATWVKDLPFVSDTESWDFDTTVVPDRAYYDELSEKAHAPVPAVTNEANNGFKTLKMSNNNGNGNGNDVADDNALLKFMQMATEATNTEIDDMALAWVTKIGKSIIERTKSGEQLSYAGIQKTAGMGKNSKKNDDIEKIKEYMEVA